MGTRHITKPQTRDETVMVRKGPGSMGTESHDTHPRPAQRLEPGLRRGQALGPARGSPCTANLSGQAPLGWEVVGVFCRFSSSHTPNRASMGVCRGFLCPDNSRSINCACSRLPAQPPFRDHRGRTRHHARPSRSTLGGQQVLTGPAVSSHPPRGANPAHRERGVTPVDGKRAAAFTGAPSPSAHPPTACGAAGVGFP